MPIFAPAGLLVQPKEVDSKSCQDIDEMIGLTTFPGGREDGANRRADSFGL